MAKAKYTKGADGYFTTKTWDGSYNQDGTKHRVTLRSKKSSADLEKQVLEAFMDGKSYQEIAVMLDRHVKSIDNALQRVKRKLMHFRDEKRNDE